MRKFVYNYKIDEEHKTIVAMSSFAGRTVAGVAHCAPKDTFDIEAGKKLAAARCNLKIAEKRMKNAEKRLAIATEYTNLWAKEKAKMEAYDADSVEAYKQALVNLTEVENTFMQD